MRLALVVLKKDARRTMKLRHNHSFGAVNHEGAGRRHQWNFAHINLLFANFLDDRFVWRFAIKQYETYLCAQCRAIGETALLAFFDVKGRMRQGIANEFEPRKPIIRHNRKNGQKRPLQPSRLEPTRRNIRLQEIIKLFKLCCQKEWNWMNTLAFCKILAESLFLSKGIMHRVSKFQERIWSIFQ